MKQKFNKVYLDYKDDENNIFEDLIGAVSDMKDDKDFDINKFYECLNKIIKETSDEDLFQIIRIMPTIKPIYYFGVLYYYLLDMNHEDSLNYEFNYLSYFINDKIDVFMVVNYLRNI